MRTSSPVAMPSCGLSTTRSSAAETALEPRAHEVWNLNPTSRF